MPYFKYTYTHTVDQSTHESTYGVYRADTLTHAKHELARRHNIRPRFETKTLEGYGELHTAMAAFKTRDTQKVQTLIVSATPLTDAVDVPSTDAASVLLEPTGTP